MAIHDTKKVNLGEICLKLMNGQIFANAGRKDGQTDRQTDIQTDDMRHNILRPKVRSGV